jgi:hypothetical protein
VSLNSALSQGQIVWRLRAYVSQLVDVDIQVFLRLEFGMPSTSPPGRFWRFWQEAVVGRVASHLLADTARVHIMARFLSQGLIDYQGAFRDRAPPEIESQRTARHREQAGIFCTARMRSAEKNPPGVRPTEWSGTSSCSSSRDAAQVLAPITQPC